MRQSEKDHIKRTALAGVALICIALLIVVVSYNLGSPKNETPFSDYSEICIDGVVYLKYVDYYQGSLAAKFNPDSTVITCGAEEITK